MHYLITIKDYLNSNGIPTDVIVNLVGDRKNGKKFTFEEHLRGLIYSLLSSQRQWSQIEQSKDEIDSIFFKYDSDEILKHTPEYFIGALEGIKCGNRNIKKQMSALHNNICILRTIEKDYGSLDNFVTSDTPVNIVKIISNGKYKLAQVGDALAWEYLRNVGIDGVKPDLHVKRFLGKNRMGNSKKDEATVEEVLSQVENLSKESGLTLAEIDSIIWNYCSDNKIKICTATPDCEHCIVKGECKYPGK